MLNKTYSKFQIKQGINIANQYIKIKPASHLTADNDACNLLVISDSSLKKAIDNLLYLLKEKKVPNFGINFPNIDTKKLLKKCCTCPNEDGVDHSQKTKVRKAAIDLITAWINPAIEFAEKGFKDEEKIIKKYSRANSKLIKKRRG